VIKKCLEHVYDEGLLSQKPLLCREAIEERTFGGHFWEPLSSDLGVVNFDGFMRSGRTQPDHCCNILALS
jgi:hypothetical protein